MQTTEECLLLYRHRLRQLLYQHGVMSNPAVDDVWILDRIEELVNKVQHLPICNVCDKPAEWVRETQFAGDHHFCDEHARKESNFGQEGSSDFAWKKLGAQLSKPSADK